MLLEADSIEMTGRISAAGGMGASGMPSTAPWDDARTWERPELKLAIGVSANPTSRADAYGHGGCGGGGRIAIHCNRIWDGNMPESENWNALDVFSSAQPDVQGYGFGHARPGGPGTLFYNCGRRRQELLIPYSASHHLEDHPWGPTVIDADAADGEIHLDTLNLQNGAR